MQISERDDHDHVYRHSALTDLLFLPEADLAAAADRHFAPTTGSAPTAVGTSAGHVGDVFEETVLTRSRTGPSPRVHQANPEFCDLRGFRWRFGGVELDWEATW